MEKFILLLVLLFCYLQGTTDEFKVISFKADPSDLAAIRWEKKDANDRPCAIIKIFTDITGLKFEANLGIVDITVKNSEYWVYVSNGERRLRILKDGFIPLQYDFPVSIQASVVYNMIIKGTDKTTSREFNVTTGMLLFKTEPTGAEVWINEEYAGVTTISREMEAADYRYRVQKKNFHIKEGTFAVLPGETHTESIPLEPSYGSVSLETTPETNAGIELDGILLPNSTPFQIDTLQSGKHSVIARKELYEPLQRDFILKDNEKKKLSLELKPVFGNLEITTLPGLTVYIDGNAVGRGSYKGRILKGIHTLEVRDNKYYTVSQKYSMEVGKNEKLELIPRPRTGSLSVITDPPEATILIDNENKGLTPKIIPGLLIGDYDLVLRKEGYARITKTITIRENEKTPVSEKFRNLIDVTFTSRPSGANIFLDSDPKGKTPMSLSLIMGSYRLKLEKKGYETIEESIEINDGNTMIDKILIQDAAYKAKKKARTGRWIFASLGVAAAGLGVYLQATTPKTSAVTGYDYAYCASALCFIMIIPL